MSIGYLLLSLCTNVKPLHAHVRIWFVPNTCVLPIVDLFVWLFDCSCVICFNSFFRFPFVDMALKNAAVCIRSTSIELFPSLQIYILIYVHKANSSSCLTVDNCFFFLASFTGFIGYFRTNSSTLMAIWMLNEYISTICSNEFYPV